MRVAIAQLEAAADKARNRETVARLVGRAASERAELVILPEEAMFSAPDDRPLADTAEPLDGPFVQRLAELARAGSLTVVAGMHESAAELPYNTVVVVGPDGLVGAYRKLHLFDALGFRESDYVLAGDGPPLTFTLGSVRVGVLNCYDIRFPELARRLVDDGAELLVVCAAWFGGRLKEDHWETLLRARAIETTCWVAASDQAGARFVGRSMLIDPMGVVRCALGEEVESVVTGELCEERTTEARRVLPVLANRRLEEIL